jgi:hypothetical protein
MQVSSCAKQQSKVQQPRPGSLSCTMTGTCLKSETGTGTAANIHQSFQAAGATASRRQHYISSQKVSLRHQTSADLLKPILPKHCSFLAMPAMTSPPQKRLSTTAAAVWLTSTAGAGAAASCCCQAIHHPLTIWQSLPRRLQQPKPWPYMNPPRDRLAVRSEQVPLAAGNLKALRDLLQVRTHHSPLS